MATFIVAIIVIGLVSCVALWIIHKQTLHARDMQSMFLQRGQFNFENQWKLWIKDREASGQTIANLAAWNAKLCESRDKTGEQLQSLIHNVETRVAQTLTRKLERALEELTIAVGKKP